MSYKPHILQELIFLYPSHWISCNTILQDIAFGGDVATYILIVTFYSSIICANPSRKLLHMKHI